MKGNYSVLSLSQIWYHHALNKFVNVKPNALDKELEKKLIHAILKGVPLPRIYMTVDLDEQRRFIYQVHTEKELLEGLLSFIERYGNTNNIPNEYFKDKKEASKFFNTQVEFFVIVEGQDEDFLEITRMFSK